MTERLSLHFLRNILYSKVCYCFVAKLCLTVILWTVACQAPLSMRFPKQEYWSELPFPPPRDLPNPEIEPRSPVLAGRFFTTKPPGKFHSKVTFTLEMWHSVREKLMWHCEAITCQLKKKTWHRVRDSLPEVTELSPMLSSSLEAFQCLARCWVHYQCSLNMHACMLSHFSSVQLYVTLWTVAHQAPLSMEFPRQEYWGGMPYPPPGDLPNPGIEPASPTSPALQAGSLHTAIPGKPHSICIAC